MEKPLNLLIISGSPMVASAVEHALADTLVPHQPHRLIGLDALSSCENAVPEIVLLAPRTWEQFSNMLSLMPESLHDCPWLVFAELRLAGLFLCHLQNQPCTIVDLYSEPQELANALSLLADGQFTCPAEHMIARFVQGLPSVALTRMRQIPSWAELQCGCAISLGLSNGEIAGLLQVAEATIKSHQHRLSRKLGVGDRHELATLVRQVFSLKPATFRGR